MRTLQPGTDGWRIGALLEGRRLGPEVLELMWWWGQGKWKGLEG